MAAVAAGRGVRVEPVPGCGTRKPRDTVSALEILRKLTEGWRLKIGNGGQSFICRLEREGEKPINLWRARVGELRDRGLIIYVMGSGRILAVELTDKGRRAAA